MSFKYRFLFTSLLTLGLLSPATWADANSENWLMVNDAYADLHTGPGRGFPIFYVVEQGERIEVLTRRPDWYEVKTESGKIGWAKADAISRTLEPTGMPVDLPNVSYGDYLSGSWVVGFSAGQFTDGELTGANNFSLNAGYKFTSWLGLEAEFGKTYKSNLSGDFYGANLLIEPFSQWPVSPYFIAGGGVLESDAQAEQVLSGRDADYFNYGLGASYYLGRNFVIRGEYRGWDASVDSQDNDQQTVKLQEWKIGFSTFF